MNGLLFWEALFTDRVFFQRDVHTVWYPRVETFVRAVAGGAWPLWDAHTAFGLPTLADPSYQIAYPPTWLNLVLPATTYCKVYVIGHCVLAGWGLFFLARRFGLSPLPAFVSAALWNASGPLLSFPNIGYHLAGITWIPWVLWALDRVLDDGGQKAALVLGALSGAQVLAGSGDMCLLTGLVGTGHVVLRLVGGEARMARLRRWAPPLVISALVGAGLSAVQWLPTMSVLAVGSRLRLEAAVNTYWSVHPLGLIECLVPRLLADLPLSAAARAIFFESREPFLASLYLGAAAFSLAALGAFASPLPRRRLAALGLAFFTVSALGRYTFFYTLLLKVPGVSMLRYPVKHMIVVALFWSLLAGFGVDLWLRDWSPADSTRARLIALTQALLGAVLVAVGCWVWLRPSSFSWLLAAGRIEEGSSASAMKLFATGTAALLAAAILAGRVRLGRRTMGLTAALVVVVLGDLTLSNRGLNPLAPPELFTHRPPVLRQMGSDIADHRLFVMVGDLTRLNGELVRGPAGWPPEWRWTLGLEELLFPPSGARWGLFGSYDGDLTGLSPVALGYLTQTVRNAWRNPVALQLLRMANVAYVIGIDEPPAPGLAEIGRFDSVFEAPIRLYRVPHPLPRAYVVDGVRILDLPETVKQVWDPAFDIEREVILEEGTRTVSEPGFSGTATVLRGRTDEFVVDTESNRAGYVVIVEAFYPGWQASVDGRSAPILRANLLFRAVGVAAGRHRITMTYRPPAVVAGAIVSLGGLLAGLLGWGLVSRPVQPPVAAGQASL